MIDSKLIHLYKALSADEKRYLRKWMEFNFVHEKVSVCQLFLFLDSRRTITPLTVRKSRVFEAIFHGEEYDDLKMRHTMWRCVEVIEECLTVHSFMQQRNNRHLQLLSVYRQKKLPQYAREVLHKIQKQHEKQGWKDGDYYLEQLQMEKQLYEIASHNTRYTELNLQQVINRIDDYAVAETLRWACIALSHQRISGTTYQFRHLEHYLQRIEEGQYANHPAVQIYYLIYKLQIQSDDALFNRLYQSVFTFEDCFTDVELKDIFLLSINYCIRAMNVGQQQYARYAFDLYMHALHKKYLLEENQLDRFTFKNIAFIAIRRLKDFHRAEKFIATYGHFLADEYREDTVAFVNATLFFEQKQYKKAMRILQRIEFADVLWNLDAKNMLMKMYFEESDFEVLLHFLNSYTAYLKRQKKIGYHQTRYLKVIHLCKKLYNNIGAGKKQKAVLRELIENDSELPEKEWLLERVRLL